jgi:Tol biopolymer transport system component
VRVRLSALVFAVVVAACGESASPQLPGNLYLVRGQTLVHVTGGRTTPIADNVFPSAFALPDGRVVAIASRGDGSPDGEQLVLVGTDGKLARLGPAAAQVRDPVVEAGGAAIVVAANLDGHSDLYRIAIDGSTTRLTNEETGNFHPSYAGAHLVYASSRDGNSELYSDARLTSEPRDDWEPTPSPDGRTIVFLSDREGPARLFTMNADGSAQRRLTSRTGDADEDQPTWSSDGTKLAYVAGGHVFVRDMRTQAERDVTAGDEPCFSPDGKWIAFTRDKDVIALALEGGESVRVAHGAHLPRWFR